MKFILMFFILAILIWGFTGLTFKDAILFTSVGLSISVVALSALLVVALTFVMAAMYAAHELGSLGKMIISQVVLVGFWMNRPGFPGECFICELRLPDHRFRWKHNKLFLLLPEEYGPAFPAIVDCYTSPPT